MENKPRALILDFDQATRIATCIDRETKKVTRIILEGGPGAKRGLFIDVDIARLVGSDEIPRIDKYESMTPGQFDSIRGTVIRSWIGFSDDPKHLTYDRKIGYTDWYGLIDCSGFDIHDWGVYIGSVELNGSDWDKNETCPLRLAESPRRRNWTDETREFYEKMLEFEKEALERRSPKNVMDSNIKAIVIHIDESTSESRKIASCFSKELESGILVKLPQEFEVGKGKLISFTDFENDGHIFEVSDKKGSIEVEDYPDSRLENDELFISAWAALPSKDFYHENKLQAFAGCFGSVEASGNEINKMKKEAAYNVELLAFAENGCLPTMRIAKVVNEVEEDSGDFIPKLFMYEQKQYSQRSKKLDHSIGEVGDLSKSGSDDTDSPTACSTSPSHASEVPSTIDNHQKEHFQGCQSNSKEESDHDENVSRRPINAGAQRDERQAKKINAEETENKSHESVFKEQNRENSTSRALGTYSEYSSNSTLSSSSSSNGQADKLPVGPKKLSFGKMPGPVPVVSGHSSNEKPEVQNCVLILQISKLEIVGYETTQLKLMKLMNDGLDIEIREWGTLRFVSDRTENGRVLMKAGSPSYSAPEGVSFSADKPPTMKTSILFSSNQNHGTSCQRIGFSDQFGHVEIPITGEELSDNTLYQTFVTMKQCDEPLSPVFQSVSPLERLNIEVPKQIYKDMQVYEQKLFEERRKNGLGSNEIPFKAKSQNSHQNNPQRKKRIVIGTSKGLVTKTCLHSNQRYGEIVTPHGFAVFSTKPSYNGLHIEVGQWLTVKLDFSRSRPAELLVKQICDVIHVDLDKIELVSGTRVPTVEGTIRLIKRVTKDNEPPIYNHNLFGNVVLRSGNSLNQEDILRFEYLRDVYEYKNFICCWEFFVIEKNPVRSVLNQETHVPYSNEMKQKFYQDESNDRPPQHYENFEKRHCYDNGYYQDQQGCSSSYEKPYHNDHHNPIDSRSAANQYVMSSNQPHPPLSYQYNQMHGNHHTPSHTGSMSSANFGQNVSRAIVTSRHRHIMVVYLEANGRAAMIYWKSFVPTVRLGAMFTCRYEKIPLSPATENVPYQVVEIIKIEESKNEVKVEDHISLSLYELNLVDFDPRYRDFPAKSAQYIVSSPNVGLVVLGKVITPDGVVSADAVVEKYKCKEYARRMAAWCRYVPCLVPQMMVDSEYEGDREVTTHVWKVVEIVSTVSHYIHNEKDTKNQNLGLDADVFEKEDDIQRQKRQAHLEYQQTNGHGFGSSSSSSTFNNSFRQSGGPSSYGTPHGSVTNSSPSFHSTHTGPVGYQQYPPSQAPSYNGYPDSHRSQTPTNESQTAHIDHLLGVIARARDSVRKLTTLEINRSHLKVNSPDELNDVLDSLNEMERTNARYYRR